LNDTKIKYIKILDKLYEIEKISFYEFSVSAAETDLTIDDVSASEVFPLEDFPEFKIKLHNWNGNVIDFQKYVESKKCDCEKP
jgi:hypothetical protein